MPGRYAAAEAGTRDPAPRRMRRPHGSASRRRQSRRCADLVRCRGGLRPIGRRSGIPRDDGRYVSRDPDLSGRRPDDEVRPSGQPAFSQQRQSSAAKVSGALSCRLMSACFGREFPSAVASKLVGIGPFALRQRGVVPCRAAFGGEIKEADMGAALSQIRSATPVQLKCRPMPVPASLRARGRALPARG